MADPRPKHYHYGPSLVNQPTPEFRGAAASLYGDRGPQRASPDYGARRRRGEPPQSIEDHIQDAIGHVAGLKPGQKLALRNELVRMVQNIGFIKLVHEQTHGPYSEAAAHGTDSQGNTYSF
jgi:hypothetical protein